MQHFKVHRGIRIILLSTESLSSQGFVEFKSHQEAKGRTEGQDKTAHLLTPFQRTCLHQGEEPREPSCGHFVSQPHP